MDDNFISICNLCRVSVRIGKKGDRPGTSSMMKHLKIHHFSISLRHKDTANILPPQNITKKTPKASLFTISESFKKNQPLPFNSPVAAAYNRAVVIFLAASMNKFAPHWKIPGCQYFAHIALSAIQRDIRVSLKKDISGAFGGKVHFTTDIWTSRQVKDYIAVTGHWVMKSDQLGLVHMRGTLAMLSFGDSHTAMNISKILKEVVDEWLKPLKFNFRAVTTDNAANYIRAFRDIRTEQVPCLAHCLNLVVRGVIQRADSPVVRILHVCCKICGRFAYSYAACKHLQEIQVHEITSTSIGLGHAKVELYTGHAAPSLGAENSNNRVHAKAQPGHQFIFAYGTTGSDE